MRDPLSSTATVRDENTHAPRLVVGIGASAGGVAAFKAFFDAMPAGHGLAFVLTQHLDPRGRSLLAKILSSHSTLAVTEAVDGVAVRADHIYTTPAGQEIRLDDGVLRLRDRAEGRPGYFPIDAFFRSLADDKQENAIAVILTGSGADGSKGVKEIKARGGVVLVQDPTTAEQPSMPTSAIATGVVDVVAPIEELAGHVVSYAEHFTRGELQGSVIAGIDRVLHLLQKEGLDLASYKTGTLSRRIQRRMGLRKLLDVPQYLEVLRSDPDEVAALRKDLLIGVTSFFRDPEAFAMCETSVLPKIFQAHDTDEIRVWVSGCSTGEEAYSMAMLLLEQRAASGSTAPIRVFATDANDAAIQVARTGTYDEASITGIAPRRLAQFFEPTEPNRFRVSRELRNIVTFASQDLLSDPPFPHLDLVCCRNVLIYLRTEAQRALLKQFHFSLNPGGYLFLGRSESIDESIPFTPVSARWRIFQRTAPRDSGDREVLPPSIRPRSKTKMRSDLPGRARREPSPIEAAAEWLLGRYAPPAVVIDDRHRIVGFHGEVEQYLNLPRGEAVLNLLAMPKEGLRSQVRTAVYRAAREIAPIRVSGGSIEGEKGRVGIDIRVEPLVAPGLPKGLLIVAFERSEREVIAQPADAIDGPAPDETYIRQLEDELKATSEDLDETVESSAAQYEELQAANEEVTSMNEELRAANEELMASTEELQALNEEVNDSNQELRDRLDSIHKLTDDLNNLLSATGIATLVLDREFRIVRATPGLRGLVNIRAADTGRPLRELTWQFDDPQLLSDAQNVLDTLTPIQREVTATNGRRYLRRLIPYRSRDDRIEGVFVTLDDIEDARKAQDDAEAASALAQNIVDTVREPLVILDAAANVVSANPAFYARFHLSPSSTEGRSFFALSKGCWDVPELRDLITEMLPRKTEIREFELVQDRGVDGERRFILNARRMMSGPSELVLLAIEEVTDRK